MISVLRGDDGPFGILIAGDRMGDIGSFDENDLALFETFSGHASVLLQNGRLERSLAEVTELKEQLHHQAFHDALTGLPNRALFAERVEAALVRTRRWVGDPPSSSSTSTISRLSTTRAGMTSVMCCSSKWHGG